MLRIILTLLCDSPTNRQRLLYLPKLVYFKFISLHFASQNSSSVQSFQHFLGILSSTFWSLSPADEIIYYPCGLKLRNPLMNVTFLRVVVEVKLCSKLTCMYSYDFDDDYKFTQKLLPSFVKVILI